MKEMLRHFVNKRHTDWDQKLESLSFPFNKAVHSTTKRSLFELRFGRLLRLLLDLLFEPLNEQEHMDASLIRQELFSHYTVTDLNNAYEVVKRNTESRMRKAKSPHERLIVKREYEVGELVALGTLILRI